MAVIRNCGGFLSRVILGLDRGASDQELLDYLFEEPHLGTISERTEYMFTQTAENSSPVELIKRILEPRVLWDLAVIRPVCALYMSCIRASFFIGIPLVIGIGLYGSVKNRAIVDITNAIGEILQLIRVFVRGLFRAVPIMGPLLGRVWSIVNVILSDSASRVCGCLPWGKGRKSVV